MKLLRFSNPRVWILGIPSMRDPQAGIPGGRTRETNPATQAGDVSIIQFLPACLLGPVSFLSVDTTHPFDSLMILVRVVRAVAGLELHGLDPSGDPSFHGPGLAALCGHLP